MNRIQRLWVGVLISVVGVAAGLVSTPAASAAPAASYGPLNRGMTSQEELREAQKFVLLLGNTASGNENYQAITYVIRSLLAKLSVRCVEAESVSWGWEEPGIRPPGFGLGADVQFALPAGYRFDRLRADVYRILRAERGMNVTNRLERRYEFEFMRVSGAVMPTPTTLVELEIGSRVVENRDFSGDPRPGMQLFSGRARDTHTAPLRRPNSDGSYKGKPIRDPRCR